MRRTIAFRDGWHKAKWLDGAASLDALTPVVQRLARPLRRLSPLERAREIHRFVRDDINYIRDPIDPADPQQKRRREQLADAATVLERRYDDCDGKSRLFVALSRAAALQARIRPVFTTPDGFTHVQAEVRFPGSRRFTADPEGWIVAETILQGVELGQGAEAALRDAYGKPLTTTNVRA